MFYQAKRRDFLAPPPVFPSPTDAFVALAGNSVFVATKVSEPLLKAQPIIAP
jgi:hypothetical protein